MGGWRFVTLVWGTGGWVEVRDTGMGNGGQVCDIGTREE